MGPSPGNRPPDERATSARPYIYRPAERSTLDIGRPATVDMPHSTVDMNRRQRVITRREGGRGGTRRATVLTERDGRAMSERQQRLTVNLGTSEQRPELSAGGGGGEEKAREAEAGEGEPGRWKEASVSGNRQIETGHSAENTAQMTGNDKEIDY